MATTLPNIARHDPDFVHELEALSQQQIQPNLSPTSVGRRIARATETGNAVSSVDLEAAIGTNDTLDVNYLERGRQAARMVCLIEVPPSPTSEGGTGTGFLVGPNLLLTNSHVLESAGVAERALAAFGVEHDVQGMRQAPLHFRLDPDAGYWRDPEDETLDFALVAIKPRSEDGTQAVEDLGFLRLNPATGKTDPGLYVTLVGHPDGAYKQVSLRDNQVLKVGDERSNRDNLLWYKADTLLGSSGSPVFNDLWQVAALHHAGVPKSKVGPEGKLLYLLKDRAEDKDSSWVTEDEAQNYREEALTWIANEGIRVSRIVAQLRKLCKDQSHPLLRAWLDDLSSVHPYPDTKPEASTVIPQRHDEAAMAISLERRRNSQASRTRPYAYYDGRNGYQKDFLGVDIPLPTYAGAVQRFGPAVKLNRGSGEELKYTNFSVVMSESRKLAFLTAVNIDGNQLEELPREDDWYFDPRIDPQYQVGNDLYTDEPSNYFDRGHLVRRRDPVWGANAQQANIDSFHWTNCAPQYWEFNQGDHLWQGLENFILYNTDSEDLRATVFTGPLFATDDPRHRGVLLPQRFWKVVAVLDDGGELSSSAYIVSQERYVRSVGFEQLPVGPHNGFQVSVSYLEQQTGLDFGEVVRAADVSTGRASKELRRLADVRHTRRTGAAVRQRIGQESVSAKPLASFVRFELAGGADTILVEADVESLATARREVRLERDRSRDTVIHDATDTFQEALEKAKPALQGIADFLQSFNNPSEVSVQLGLKVSAEAGIILAKLGSEGTLNVTLKWVNGN